MNKKQVKRRRDMKTKLMAAICMLLVSSIMMVSTTYAWFTLSTAPEVTGINTAVGANGNLEMALVPASGDLNSIKSSDGDSTLAANLRNVTWGNLVDVSDSTFYGMDKIMLYPAALNAAVTDANGNPTSLAEAMLKTPAYGADGRVSELLANTVASAYEATSDSFPVNTSYGVRAVGTASGMTPRQLAYRNYRSEGSTAMNQATIKASQSLMNNGNILANIALVHAADPTATHSQAQVDALKAIIADLINDGGVLRLIENGYKSYIIALGASKTSQNGGLDDTEFTAFAGTINAQTDTNGNGTVMDEVLGVLATNGVTLESALGTAIGNLIDTIVDVKAAQDGLNALSGKTEYTWDEISTPLNKLATINAMQVNGVPASEVKDRISEVFAAMSAGQGLTVSIATGGGVYADVADHCGDFSADIIITKASFGSYEMENLPARMTTKTSQNPVYLTLMATAVNLAGSPEGTGTTMPISDFYGYVIDLAFRTNAADSNLLLQQTAEDRIYEGSQGAEINNESTMGHGATMEFTSSHVNFTTDQMKNLMKSIRIVFFKPDTREVVATGKLDVDNATVVGTTVTATIYLYTNTAGGGYVEATFDADAQAAGTKYYSEAVNYTEVTDAANFQGQLYTENSGVYETATYDATSGATYYEKVVSYAEYTANTAPADGSKLYVVQAAGEAKKTDNVIMALPQNTAVALSVLVYLDGETIQNKDVAIGDSSMTGTMNLQFASSANLTPMNYTQLMPQGNTPNP